MSCLVKKSLRYLAKKSTEEHSSFVYTTPFIVVLDRLLFSVYLSVSPAQLLSIVNVTSRTASKFRE